ncbi:hypothetical protein ACBR40_15845 [Nonomuraea sp. AD125B]|jgi:hypothetical protein|uniref:hypothetical protein n=1 Tax=Nonomuraea TaxID=83681 RepID=UPI0035280401
MTNDDKEEDDAPSVASEFGRTVRDALESKARTVRLCLILAVLGTSMTIPLFILLIALRTVAGGN